MDIDETTNAVDQAVSPDNSDASVSPASSDKGAGSFLELESLIKRYLTQLQILKDDLKKQKEILNDAFGNDAVYNEQEEKAKEATKVKSTTKQQILHQPALVEVQERVDDLRTQVKEAEEVLSDYLIQYQKATGFNEIETETGETLIIVNHAKLIKGSSPEKP